MSSEGRRGIANQLLASERTYIEKLKALAVLYIQPLTISANDPASTIIDRKDIPLVFSNVEVISGLSDKFIRDLDARTRSGQDSFGDILQEFLPFLKMYNPYIVNYDNAILFVQNVKAIDPRFRDLCDVGKKNPMAKGASFEELLFLPISHLTETSKLIKQLADATPPNHPDYQNMNRATVLMSEIAASQAEVQRQAKNRALIRAIEDKFIIDPGFTSPGRELRCQGILVKQNRNGEQKYHFFLFNDLLAYATIVGWKFKLNRKLPINERFGVADAPNTADGRCAFQIISAEKSFLVYTSSDISKTNWMEDIRNCVEEQRRKRGGAAAGSGGGAYVPPVLQPDAQLNNCPLCQQEFTMLRPKRHCRSCGTLVCNDCSEKRVIPGSNDKKERRMCKKCVDVIKSGGKVAPKAFLYKDPSASQRSYDPSSSPAPSSAVSPRNVTSASAPLARPEARRESVENEIGLSFTVVKTAVSLNASTRREYVTYDIRVQGHGLDVTVSKRYSHFSDFDKKFRRMFPSIPYHLPPAVIFGGTDPIVIAERSRGFVRYLSSLCTVRALWPMIGEFLGVKEAQWFDVAHKADEYKQSRHGYAADVPELAPKATQAFITHPVNKEPPPVPTRRHNAAASKPPPSVAPPPPVKAVVSPSPSPSPPPIPSTVSIPPPVPSVAAAPAPSVVSQARSMPMQPQAQSRPWESKAPAAPAQTTYSNASATVMAKTFASSAVTNKLQDWTQRARAASRDKQGAAGPSPSVPTPAARGLSTPSKALPQPAAVAQPQTSVAAASKLFGAGGLRPVSAASNLGVNSNSGPVSSFRGAQPSANLVERKFPAANVGFAAKAPPPVPAARTLKATVRADYYPATPQEMTLTQGVTITILDRSNADGWWYGRDDSSGREGYFPATYVALVE